MPEKGGYVERLTGSALIHPSSMHEIKVTIWLTSTHFQTPGISSYLGGGNPKRTEDKRCYRAPSNIIKSFSLRSGNLHVRKQRKSEDGSASHVTPSAVWLKYSKTME